MPLGGRKFYPHFTDEKTRAQIGGVTSSVAGEAQNRLGNVSRLQNLLQGSLWQGLPSPGQELAREKEAPCFKTVVAPPTFPKLELGFGGPWENTEPSCLCVPGSVLLNFYTCSALHNAVRNYWGH